MSLDIGTLVARLQVQSTGASDLAKAETSLTSQAAKTGQKIGQSITGSYTKALKNGLTLAAGFIAFKSVESFIRGSIDAAKELNTTIARTETVFGKSTDSVEKWAGTTDRSLGLSKQAALEYAAQLGNVYEQLGFTATASAALSEKTTSLAVQIGAFKKEDPSQVIAAITAGYRGQFRGLAQLVPGITAATVEQEALNETGKTNVKTLTAAEKATATLALVQKDSGNAQKFYASTVGEADRQQKVFNAELDNLKAKVGQDAIPLITTLTKIAADDLIPAIETAGHDLEQLAKDINGLPSPVKAAGASLLALVLLGPEIRELADSVGNNLGSAIETARIQALYMKDDFAKAGGGVKGLTVAIGTGAGEGLLGAGKGLLNLVGGPWGAAFIGASAAVGVLISKHEQAKQEVSSFTEAIKADSGALGTNTRAAVVNALSKTDAFKQAKTLGLSLDDLTSSLLGNADATARVDAAFQAHNGAITQGFLKGTNAQDQAAFNLSHTLGDTGNALNKAVTGAKDYSAAMGPAAEGSSAAATQADALATSTGAVATETKAATAAVKTYIEKLDDATGHTVGVQEANIAWQQSIADAKKALHDNGKTLDENSQKGRDNRTAILDMVTALQGRADALGTSGKLTDGDITKLKDQKQQLIDVAAKFFGSRDAAQKYIDKLIKIPKNIKTTLTLATSGISQIDRAIIALQTLQQNKRPGGGGTTVNANGNLYYANGGENHVAQIAAAGANRVWAEPETGGEAYIPLAASKRARSTAILSEVADKFGYGGMGGPSIGSLLTVGTWSPGYTPQAAAEAIEFQLRAQGIS